MNYKTIIKNKETRLNILRLLNSVPDAIMLKIQYRMKLGRKLNLKKPERFTEKLQWYKLNYRNDLMTTGSDKYKAREYVKAKGLENILSELYAVYSNPNEIALDVLPDKFVMKTNNGSGTNYFCKDKSSFPLEQAKKELSIWLNRNVYAAGREWSYKNIKPKIVVEEYLEERKTTSQFDGISDYKFLCFGGEPKYIIFDVDRFSDHKRNIYNLDWDFLNIETDKKNINKNIPKPNGLKEMIEVAKILSEDFPFVRVDLYYVNNQVYFGELTFYPWTGYVQFTPDEFDHLLGEEFEINKKNSRNIKKRT